MSISLYKFLFWYWQWLSIESDHFCTFYTSISFCSPYFASFFFEALQTSAYIIFLLLVIELSVTFLVFSTQGSNLCGPVSSSSWNGPNRWVVKLVIFVFRSVGSNHFWNLIWTSILYYCFSPPRRGGDCYSTPLAHSGLVHVFEVFLVMKHPRLSEFCNISACNFVLCEGTTVPFQNFAIFLPVIFQWNLILNCKFGIKCYRSWKFIWLV